MIRPRGRTRGGADSAVPEVTSSVDIGTTLREARLAKGLGLVAVHDQLGRSITQIECLEAGSASAFDHPGLAVSAVRRYATLLGLDGDDLASRFAAGLPADGDDVMALTGVVAATTGAGGAPEHLRAFHETGEIPAVSRRTGLLPATDGAGLSTGPPTGTFPVVPRTELRQSRRSVAKARRRLRAPTFLKVMTWLAGLLVLVVLAGFVMLEAKPQTLANAHILQVVQPGGSSTPSTAGGTTTTTRPVQASPVVAAGGDASSATYTVATSHFDVVVATGNNCWIQVTSSTVPQPLASGVQPAGKVLTFPAQGTMTVQVGASSVLVGITIKGKNVFSDAPKTAPFTYTFQPASP